MLAKDIVQHSQDKHFTCPCLGNALALLNCLKTPAQLECIFRRPSAVHGAKRIGTATNKKTFLTKTVESTKTVKRQIKSHAESKPKNKNDEIERWAARGQVGRVGNKF